MTCQFLDGTRCTIGLHNGKPLPLNCAACMDAGENNREYAARLLNRRRIRLGDMVEALAKPIAKALRLSCLDENNRLRAESPCAKRRDRLNALTSH